METWDEMVKRHTAELKSLENLHKDERQDAEKAGETTIQLKVLESHHKFAVDAIETRQRGQAENHPDWEKGLDNGPSVNRYLTEEEKLRMELNAIADWTRELQTSKTDVGPVQSNGESPKESPVGEKSIFTELKELLQRKKPGAQEWEP
ncbi:hypothetical protein LXM25_05880 [Dyadobacter sp. LJ53]|uniref:hypothetical protein n=1 Tax=Dyadobacter chenwenxiniae TaxID=2906456 RepID=UPI001F2E3F8D|nr:hypothetical protein [Dyadobacter chenwenxiniae]MCF0049573.1 hypothetical protein [Dyadobacter chenwenxiniae]